jgi:type IV fimbrial biogenesis protein FimT
VADRADRGSPARCEPYEAEAGTMSTGARCNAGPRGRGFTLIELSIAVALVGILFAIALPSWGHYFAEHGVRERADALADAFLLARSEAIRRGGRVAVCPRSADRCDPRAAGWEHGWLVFADDNRNGVRDADEPVVVLESAASEAVTIRGNRPVADYVSYTSKGQLRRIDGALQMGTFVVCRSGFAGRKVVLANGGRVRIAPADSVCP